VDRQTVELFQGLLKPYLFFYKAKENLDFLHAGMEWKHHKKQILKYPTENGVNER